MQHCVAPDDYGHRTSEGPFRDGRQPGLGIGRWFWRLSVPLALLAPLVDDVLDVEGHEYERRAGDPFLLASRIRSLMPSTIGRTSAS
jgi:hypothetical protein